MLTAKGDDIDRIIGLEMGADDYLAKPFNPRELLARIRAVLRRAAATSPLERRARTLSFLGWQIDCVRRELKDPNGTRIVLTSAEFGLLQVLCERAGRVLSRDQLLDLTQTRSAGSLERSIDVLISRLRRKIERDPHDPAVIKTVVRAVICLPSRLIWHEVERSIAATEPDQQSDRSSDRCCGHRGSRCSDRRLFSRLYLFPAHFPLQLPTLIRSSMPRHRTAAATGGEPRQCLSRFGDGALDGAAETIDPIPKRRSGYAKAGL